MVYILYRQYSTVDLLVKLTSSSACLVAQIMSIKGENYKYPITAIKIAMPGKGDSGCERREGREE